MSDIYYEDADGLERKPTKKEYFKNEMDDDARRLYSIIKEAIKEENDGDDLTPDMIAEIGVLVADMDFRYNPHGTTRNYTMHMLEDCRDTVSHYVKVYPPFNQFMRGDLGAAINAHYPGYLDNFEGEDDSDIPY